MAFVNKKKTTKKAAKRPVRIKNHNKTMTTVLVAKKMNYQKSNKNDKTEPWDRIMENAHNTIQDTFEETCKTFFELNPGMKIEQAEKKAFDELK